METNLKECIVSEVVALARLSAKTESLLNETFEWAEPVNISSCRVSSKAIGVYKIIYGPTMETKYIGQGNIGARRGRHTGVFRNDGQDMVSPNGHVSPSQAGKKMFIHDSNLDNWLFSYLDVKLKNISSKYEEVLVMQEEPEFNNTSMSGVS